MSTTIHLMQGLPASGKSTYVRGNFTNGELVVSRDQLRKMFGLTSKGILDNAGEKEVTKVQMALVRDAIQRGQDVVIDNTNLNWNAAQPFYKLGVNVVPHVMDTSVDECVRRNALREDRVPDGVIERMAAKPACALHTQTFEPYVPDTTLPPAYIFDIDGTLADSRGVRDVYDNTRVHLDKLIEPVAWVYGALERVGYDILFLSGRAEGCREQTQNWLREHVVSPREPLRLYMRPEGDRRDDAVVKSELFDLVAQHYNVLGVFDDRERVANMRRTRGIKTFHVDYGQF